MKKILLVEDDMDIISHLTLFLESEGFVIKNTDSQTQAKKMIYNQNFDLFYWIYH